MTTGDSFTVGYGNTGGTTHCNATACNPVTGSCLPELDSQDALLAWGPLTAANFTADYQVSHSYTLSLTCTHPFSTWSGCLSQLDSHSALPAYTY